jgi:Phage integrase family
LRLVNPQSRFVFNTERGGPVTRALKMVRRTGGLAKLPFPIHPHMLRHACGFKLANDGVDTRELQHFLGHRLIGQKPNQRLRISRQYAPDCVNPDGHWPVFGIATGASRRIGTQYAASLAYPLGHDPTFGSGNGWAPPLTSLILPLESRAT